MNASVVASDRLRQEFDVAVVPLRFAASISEISSLSAAKLWRSLHAAWSLASSLRAHEPDALYFTLTPSGLAFYRDCAFIAIAKAFGVSRIFHMHGQGAQAQLDRSWRRAIYRWAFDKAWVLHLSPRLAADTEQLVPGERVRIVPNGITSASVPLQKRSASERLRILYLSTMAREKGPLVLLEAIAALRARGRSVVATFAGPPYGDCVDAFTARSRELGLDDVVRYVGPAMGEAKDALYREHDVFVMPSFREAFPLVVLEAMQHGLPVVASRVGAMADMVEDGATGVLVPPGRASAIADAIDRLRAAPATAAEMGARGQARYREHFTLDHFEASLLSALRDIVGGSA
jgi:glycosyltransferase involved in cell wall biosynthesis